MIAAFLILSIVAVVLLILGLCDAAGSADERLDEMAREHRDRACARVIDFPERRQR